MGHENEKVTWRFGWYAPGRSRQTSAARHSPSVRGVGGVCGMTEQRYIGAPLTLRCPRHSYCCVGGVKGRGP